MSNDGSETAIAAPTKKVGDKFTWLMGEVVVRGVVWDESAGDFVYEVANEAFENYGLKASVPQRLLDGKPSLRSQVFFSSRPTVTVVENFYRDPHHIREVALHQEYKASAANYKGKRSVGKFLFPKLREEFERILGVKIRGWLTQPVNGVFQITHRGDPLVYHSDAQQFAAAVYLTPNAPPGSGTSFWRSRKFGCRRPPTHPGESAKFPSDQAIAAAQEEMYSEQNLLSVDGWELVDKVEGVFNRLVIWDAQLVHSASGYDGFPGVEEEDFVVGGAESGDAGGVPRVPFRDGVSPKEAAASRLVQLFFFDIE